MSPDDYPHNSDNVAMTSLVYERIKAFSRLPKFIHADVKFSKDYLKASEGLKN